MRVFTTLPQEDLRKVGPAAQAIEAAGYTGVSTQENRHDPFLALAVAGVATQKIELHTGVAISFARSPMTVANVGWDLAASTGGRFTLGLGSQIRAHNERRFSVPWTAPAPRMREMILAIRAIWDTWENGTPLATSHSTASALWRAMNSAARSSTRPAPASCVSRTWDSMLSSLPSTPTMPPCAQAALLTSSAAHRHRATGDRMKLDRKSVV